MKVLISVKGRFHAFDLAKQLDKHNVLFKLNTTYPKKIVKKWGIASAKIKSNIVLEFLNRFFRKILSNGRMKIINNYVNKKQAKSNIKFLKEVDVYIGWSGSSLETLIEAKKLGVTTILERGSSHYNYQMKVLHDEAKITNTDFVQDYRQWQRELLEYQLADYISVPSLFVERSFIENGIHPKKILRNPYGVDLSSFRQIEKSDDVFRVIFVGGFSFRKGAHYLLQAFSELNLDNSELLHIGGVNPEMKSYIAKYKRENIKYLGIKPQNELYKYYSQGSVFVILSIEEGLAMVQPQAMACGLPLICSTNTGGEDLLSANGEEGYVLPIRDVEAVKEKLLLLYNDKNSLQDMSNKAKQRVEKGFSWDDYGLRYLNNLKSIIADKSD